MDNVINGNNMRLERFSADNIEHLKVASIFKKDSLIKKFFSEWEQITYLSVGDDTNTYYSYVVFIDGIPAGMTTIVFNDDTTVTFSLGFLPKFRGSGNGGKLRSLILDYAFSHGIERVKGYIKRDNIRNLRSVEKSGGEIIDFPGADLVGVCYEKPVTR